MSDIPELLYHTTLVVYDGNRDASNRSRSAFVLGTHTTLAAAKAFSKTALEGLGYTPSDFLEYHVKNPSIPEDEWTFGDGVVVYAKAFSGEEFDVGLDTTPNEQKFAGTPDGNLKLKDIPADCHNPTSHLHYVLQTKVDYDQDHCRVCPGNDMSAFKSTEIQGCFLHRREAIQAAKKCLKSTGYEFAQYDERDNLGKADDVSHSPLLSVIL